MTPEHLHLALNHITFIGLACAIVPLVVGLIMDSKATVVSGLILAALCGLSTGAVMGTGEEAYERYLNGPVSPLLSPGSDYWLEVHEERAHTWSKLMYLTTAAAIAALVVVWWKPAWTRWTTIPLLALCVASTGAGVYIAEAGGKIRRPDFRATSAPANEPASALPGSPGGEALPERDEHDGADGVDAY